MLSAEKGSRPEKPLKEGSHIPLSSVFLLLICCHLNPTSSPTSCPLLPPNQDPKAWKQGQSTGVCVGWGGVEGGVCVKLAFKILTALIYHLCFPEQLLSSLCLDLLYDMSIPISKCSVIKSIARS